MKKNINLKSKFFPFTASFTKEGKWYVVKCLELGVCTQGKTLEEAEKNIVEACELYLEDEKIQNIPSPVMVRPFAIAI